MFVCTLILDRCDASQRGAEPALSLLDHAEHWEYLALMKLNAFEAAATGTCRPFTEPSRR